jgi:hypothetical protein
VSPSHRASHRADSGDRGERETPRPSGGSHRGSHAAPRVTTSRTAGRRFLRNATITGGLASLATAAVVGGGVLSAGSPVIDAAGDLAAAAASGPSVAPLSAADLAARARVPVSRSDRRDSVDRDKAATLAQPRSQAMTGTESLAQEDPRTIASALLAEFGYSADQFSCLDSLWMSESGWRVDADNPSSSAYGIPQALPGSKMASEGADWATNPVTQIRWGLGYIRDRYGSPCSALSFKQGRGWY